MRILFLYTELADYTLACMRALKNAKEEPEIAVIHYPVNPEAPFDFDFSGIAVFSSLHTFKHYSDLKKFADNFRPDKIVVSGWANKWYLRICLSYRKKAICILTMDNNWTGSLKQRTFTHVSRFTLIHIFKKIWVPGDPQVIYAKKLGFKVSDIITGFYCCDVNAYTLGGEKALQCKNTQFPQRMLCVARYIPAKNYTLLWQTFIQWKNQTQNSWELWCAGAGEDFDKRIQHPAIRHLGFVQKEDWDNIIAQTGVFILPSLFEPWAVVVQEFAAAGYPMILSSQVGAASLFLKKENGWVFDPGNAEELTSIFRTMEALSSEALREMGAQSRKIAQSITPERWAVTLIEA